MSTITTLPTPPSRANPDTFADDADAFLGALPTFGSELNTVAGEAEGNAAAATAAAAVKNTDNFKGAWSSGTTYAVGESVSKNNLFWLSKQAGNLNKDPETQTAWWDAVTRFAPDSAATTDLSSADLTLLASSARVHAVSSTTYGKSVHLPIGTSLFNSVDTFVITNTGNAPIALRDYNGKLLKSIEARGTAKASLADNATAAGVWAVEGNGLSSIYWKRIKEEVATGHYHVTTFSKPILKLDASTDVLFTTEGTSIYATIYDVTTDTLGTTVSLGTVASLGAFGASYVTTSGFLVWCETQLIAATVSGTAITAGSAVTHSYGSNGTSTSNPLSFTQVDTDVFCGFLWSSTQPQAKAFSVSGNTITAGTATNIGATVTTAAEFKYTKVLSTTALLVHVPNTTTNFTIRHISVDASRVVTYNDISSTISATMQTPIVYLDTDSYCFTSKSGSTTSFKHITLSGSAITIANTYTIGDDSSYWVGNTGYDNVQHILPISTTKVLLNCYSVSGSNYFPRWRIGSTTAIFTSSTDGVGSATSIGNALMRQNDPDTFKTAISMQSSSPSAAATEKSSGYGILDNSLLASDTIKFSLKNNFLCAPENILLANLTSPNRKVFVSCKNKAGYSYMNSGIQIYSPDSDMLEHIDTPFLEYNSTASYPIAVHTDTCVMNLTTLCVMEVAQ